MHTATRTVVQSVVYCISYVAELLHFKHPAAHMYNTGATSIKHKNRLKFGDMKIEDWDWDRDWACSFRQHCRKDQDCLFSSKIAVFQETFKLIDRHHFRKQSPLLRTISCSSYSSKKYTWLQQRKKPQIQGPGTTFSSFGDEVGMEGDNANCCRFTNTHGGAPRRTYLPCDLLDQWKNS